MSGVLLELTATGGPCPGVTWLASQHLLLDVFERNGHLVYCMSTGPAFEPDYHKPPAGLTYVGRYTLCTACQTIHWHGWPTALLHYPEDPP